MGEKNTHFLFALAFWKGCVSPLHMLHVFHSFLKNCNNNSKTYKSTGFCLNYVFRFYLSGFFVYYWHHYFMPFNYRCMILLLQFSFKKDFCLRLFSFPFLKLSVNISLDIISPITWSSLNVVYTLTLKG